MAARRGDLFFSFFCFFSPFGTFSPPPSRRRQLKVSLPRESLGSRKRAIDQEDDESAKQRALDQVIGEPKESVEQRIPGVLNLLSAGRLDEALALVAELKLAARDDFCQYVLVRLHEDLRTTATLSKFADAGLDIANLWPEAAICAIIQEPSEPGVYPPDDYMLALVKHANGCRIPYVSCTNILGAALTADPEHAPSPRVLAAIRERCANTAEWLYAFSLALQFAKPHVGERLAGVTLMVNGKDVTKTFPDRIIEISRHHLVTEAMLDQLVSYFVASGMKLEWLRSFCCYPVLLGSMSWWRKILDRHGAGLVSQEWVTAVSDSFPSDQPDGLEKRHECIMTALKKAAAATEAQ